MIFRQTAIEKLLESMAQFVSPVGPLPVCARLGAERGTDCVEETEGEDVLAVEEQVWTRCVRVKTD